MKRMIDVRWKIDYDALSMDVLISLEEAEMTKAEADRRINRVNVIAPLTSEKSPYGKVQNLSIKTFLRICDVFGLDPRHYLILD